MRSHIEQRCLFGLFGCSVDSSKSANQRGRIHVLKSSHNSIIQFILIVLNSVLYMQLALLICIGREQAYPAEGVSWPSARFGVKMHSLRSCQSCSRAATKRTRPQDILCYRWPVTLAGQPQTSYVQFLLRVHQAFHRDHHSIAIKTQNTTSNVNSRHPN